MERIAVVYDVGAATPTEILGSLDGLAEPVFVLPDSEQGSELAELISDFAAVTTFDTVLDHRPRGVLTFSDYQLEPAANLAERLGVPFHSPEAALNITRKFRQRSILNERGVDPTPTTLLTSLAAAAAVAGQIPLPAVLKPNRGFGGTNTYLVESTEELLTLAERLFGAEEVAPDDGYVAEGLIAGVDVAPPWGNYVSVESMVRGGEISHIGITGKLALTPPFREQGSYLPARTDAFDADAVLALTTNALTALGVGDSICHTEVKLTPDGPRIIEVNGRLGHPIYDLFKRAHRVDLIRVAAQLALGERPAIRLHPSRDVVYHYFGLPPVGAWKLSEISGLGQLRARGEVEQVSLLIKPPSSLDWRRGFQERIYTCIGRTDNHAALADFASRIDDILGIRYL
ncbi:hypothetical protein C6361_01790 [Plantactinospora sp. BC1]|uniref:ATP-grasp domain-containing protein n=1 Tax=Plantactinospora sp. BC1 TaxID=2108470 RepID=UPI000D166ED3|nr:hypothetical protein [Plantactinospora sp. BC1]AVT28439.1 hypothetical protein C6361_01790 [Plantactinospora sp. BC1]